MSSCQNASIHYHTNEGDIIKTEASSKFTTHFKTSRGSVVFRASDKGDEEGLLGHRVTLSLHVYDDFPPTKYI